MKREKVGLKVKKRCINGKREKRDPKTDNPKRYRIAVKLDQEAKDILDAYCEQEKVSAMEATRRGIKRLKPDLE